MRWKKAICKLSLCETQDFITICVVYHIILYFFDQTSQLLFFSLHVSVRWLFEGSVYFARSSDRAATIQMQLPFKGGYYSNASTIQGWHLFEGGAYSNAATINFKGGNYLMVAFIWGIYSWTVSLWKKYSTWRRLWWLVIVAGFVPSDYMLFTFLHSFILIACDGLWKAFSIEEAAKFIITVLEVCTYKFVYLSCSGHILVAVKWLHESLLPSRPWSYHSFLSCHIFAL